LYNDATAFLVATATLVLVSNVSVAYGQKFISCAFLYVLDVRGRIGFKLHNRSYSGNHLTEFKCRGKWNV